jgi:hypothetical protein
MGYDLLLLLAPTQIAKMSVMTPKMMLFHVAPTLLEKLYTHGEIINQIPINPVSQSCHMINTSLIRLYRLQRLHNVDVNITICASCEKNVLFCNGFGARLIGALLTIDTVCATCMCNHACPWHPVTVITDLGYWHFSRSIHHLHISPTTCSTNRLHTPLLL